MKNKYVFRPTWARLFRRGEEASRQGEEGSVARAREDGKEGVAGEPDGGVVAGEVDGRIGWQRSSLSPDSTILPQPPQVDGRGW